MSSSPFSFMSNSGAGSARLVFQQAFSAETFQPIACLCVCNPCWSRLLADCSSLYWYLSITPMARLAYTIRFPAHMQIHLRRWQRPIWRPCGMASAGGHQRPAAILCACRHHTITGSLDPSVRFTGTYMLLPGIGWYRPIPACLIRRRMSSYASA